MSVSSVPSIPLTFHRLAAAESPGPHTAPGGVTIPLRLRFVTVAFAAGIAVLLLAGSAVSVLTILLGHDHLMGLAPLLDLNGEHNLPTWFSSMLLLSASALLAVAAHGAHPHVRGHWKQLAVVFLFLSVDETASLHEMTNAPLRGLLHAGPMFYFPWLALGIVFATFVAFSQRALLLGLPLMTRRLFILAGALYVVGAAGLEAVTAPIYVASGKHSLVHAGLVGVEEGLEMCGAALFLLALLHYVTSAHAPLLISFDERERPAGALSLVPRRVMAGLIGVLSALAVISISTQAIHYLTSTDVPALVRLVNLSREGNLPTWYQTSALLACSVPAAIIAASAFRARSPFRAQWALVAAALVYMSADEAAAIHELSVKPLRTALGASGLLYYPWVIIGLAVVVIAAMALRTFMAALPAPTRKALLTAAGVFLVGALGIEALSGMFAEQYGRDNFGYGLITTLEESLEMFGVVIAIRGLMEHIRDHVGAVTLGGAAGNSRWAQAAASGSSQTAGADRTSNP